jgi:hypothetical protein
LEARVHIHEELRAVAELQGRSRSRVGDEPRPQKYLGALLDRLTLADATLDLAAADLGADLAPSFG